ncbi:MAG: hypothetical protein JSR26_05160 [Proteobacteria bacterium]|nr:hypothetical protein [Pseudomonadota bacterium]
MSRPHKRAPRGLSAPAPYLDIIDPFAALRLERISETEVRLDAGAIRRTCGHSSIDPVRALQRPEALAEIVRTWYASARRRGEPVDPIAEEFFGTSSEGDSTRPLPTFLTTDPATAVPDTHGFPSNNTLVRQRLVEHPGAGFVRHAPPGVIDALADLYASPLYALAALAPQVLAIDNARILLTGRADSWARDQGRWLGLFHRLLPGRRNWTLCCKGKPMRGTQKDILFQPPLHVIQKSWIDHLESLQDPPDAVLVASPDDFDEIRDGIEALHAIARSRPVLWGSPCGVSALLEAALLRAHGFEVGEPVWLGMATETSLSYTSGSTWMHLVAKGDTPARPSAEHLEALRRTQAAFIEYMPKGVNTARSTYMENRYGRPTPLHRDGHAPMTVLFTRDAQVIEVGTGQVYRFTGERFDHQERSIPPEIMQLCPVADGATPTRLEIVMWLAHASAQLDGPTATSDRAPVPAAAEPTKPPLVLGAPPAEANTPLSLVNAPGLPSRNSPPKETAPPTEPAPPVFRLRPKLSTSAGTTPVMAVSAGLGAPGADPTAAYDRARRATLAWLGQKGYRIDPEATSVTLESPNGEIALESDAGRVWSLRFDDRSAMEQGAFWRVEITLVGDTSPALGLRVSQIRRRESAPPPQPGAPRVLRDIAEQVGLFESGHPLRSRPWTPAGVVDGQRLLALLEDPARLQPVVVVLVRSADEMAQGCDHLASRLTGTAHVVRIDADIAAQLDRSLGRSRSLHGRMVRIYPPHFGRDHDPFSVPLWTLDGASINAALANTIISEACAQGLAAVALDDRVPTFQDVRKLIVEARVAEAQRMTQVAHASVEEERERGQRAQNEMAAALATYRAELDEALKELTQLTRERDRALAERDDALDENRRLRFRLSASHRDTGADVDTPDAEVPQGPVYPNTWDGIEDWVAAHCEGRVVVLPQAIKMARDSSYPDIAFTYQVLEFLAKRYVPMRQRSTTDTEAFDAFEAAKAELGVEVAKVGNAVRQRRYKHEYKRTYEGRTVTLDQHVKRGVGFDPASIYRLYFAYDNNSGKAIVGAFPGHLTNSITH